MPIRASRLPQLLKVRIGITFYHPMQKDFAFMFYPGDYLRDTQCLSEKAQVAYDRIMCEHMRNICITQQQLNFFTKKLNPDEIEELLMVLTKSEHGYYIEWVVLSISKRKAYNESRSKNRLGKTKNISKSYVPHKEDEFNKEDNSNLLENSKLISPKMVSVWKEFFPTYPINVEGDLSACLKIAYAIAAQKGWKRDSVLNGNMDETLTIWRKIVQFSAKDEWYSSRTLTDLSKPNEWQRLVKSMTSKPVKEEKKIQSTAPPLKRIDP